MNRNKLTLGILFNFRQGWMGGIIYILNVIRILDFLEDEKKPNVILFYRPDLKKFTEEIKYPYLKTVEWPFPSINKGYLKSWLTGRNEFVNKILQDYDLDGIFPMLDYPVRIKTKTKLVAWYADLQHEYYPEFFTKIRLMKRAARIKLILRNTDDLIVSSQAVADDFQKFFKVRKDLNVHIFHFASVIDDLSGISIDDLKQKYKLPSKYFMISNQFHKHKNHKAFASSDGNFKRKRNKD